MAFSGELLLVKSLLPSRWRTAYEARESVELLYTKLRQLGGMSDIFDTGELAVFNELSRGIRDDVRPTVLAALRKVSTLCVENDIHEMGPPDARFRQ